MKIIGLITTVSPYRGSLSPQPISFSTYLFNYRNYHAQTALHELVDDHVFLTSVRCKWHSNPNFWGEMEWKRLVWCALLMPECQAFEGSLAWMLYWSNVLFLLDTLKPCYLQTLSIIKASAKSTVLQVALVAGCGSKDKHALPPQATHEPWWRRKHCFVSRPVGEAKTVLPVTMLAKQGRESSCVLDLTHSRQLTN